MSTFYSNSKNDRVASAEGRTADESAVRTMYEFAPYPDLGADLKDNMSLYLAPIRDELAQRKNVKFLDAGCGTGHHVVAVARQHPDWECHGLDLSGASIDIARKLAEKHGVKVQLQRGSYLDPLPYTIKFDVILAMGTIHHCADPVAAMKILRNALKPDGYLLLHLYGMRGDRDKFDIKEALSILEPNLESYENRFRYYSALMHHRRQNLLKRLALTTPADVWYALKTGWRNLNRRRRNVSWSPPFTAGYDEITAPWVDHFCHPCERAYELPEVRALIEASGFTVAHMLKQGKERMNLIPPEWLDRYRSLDNWEKWRLSELLAIGGGSFSIVARPK